MRLNIPKVIRPTLTVVPNFSPAQDEALSIATFCTEGTESAKVAATGKIISNKMIADNKLNNIFVTLRTALY